MDHKIAIKAENLSKCYRVGLKEKLPDSLSAAFLNILRSPFKNFRKYRSLYVFDDLGESDDLMWALRDISFEVRPGEVLGIIGRNGAGKSTLLKILSRVTTPTSGTAEIRGRVSSLLEVGTGFHKELTGRENVYLNGTILGMKKKEIDRSFDEIVNFSGIEKFIDTPVKRYSSGMRVRLAFSVAAHLQPEILVIDEVLAVGDLEFQKKCLNKMEDVGQSGRTVLFVSHNLAAVTRLCTRAILLEDGANVADGPSETVVKRYLSAGQENSSEKEWPDLEKAPGRSIVRLRAIRIRTADDKSADAFDIRHPIQVQIEYEVITPGHQLRVRFALLNENGDFVFVSYEQDAEWRYRPRPRGCYISTAWIPGNLLAEGMHYVNCFITTTMPEKVEVGEFSIVGFQVVDTMEGDSARGEIGRRIPGVVRPLLEWKTQLITL
jgi:lipopolysaccharide transport system ATP-binding protein